jgi:hypothetical protein
MRSWHHARLQFELSFAVVGEWLKGENEMKLCTQCMKLFIFKESKIRSETVCCIICWVFFICYNLALFTYKVWASLGRDRGYTKVPSIN